MFRILGYDPTGSEESRREIETSPQIALYLRDAFVAVCPEDRSRIKKIFHDNYGSKHFDTGSYRLTKKDGSLVWVSQELIFREDTPQGRLFYLQVPALLRLGVQSVPLLPLMPQVALRG